MKRFAQGGIIYHGSTGVAAAAVETPHPWCQHTQTVTAGVGACRQAAAAAAHARRWRRRACASTYRPATATSPAAKRRVCTWLSKHLCISPVAQSNVGTPAFTCTCGWIARYAILHVRPCAAYEACLKTLYIFLCCRDVLRSLCKQTMRTSHHLGGHCYDGARES